MPTNSGHMRRNDRRPVAGSCASTTAFHSWAGLSRFALSILSSATVLTLLATPTRMGNVSRSSATMGVWGGPPARTDRRHGSIAVSGADERTGTTLQGSTHRVVSITNRSTQDG